MLDELHEECGIFGISIKNKSTELIKDLYYGLFALQHRGQESCGISYFENGTIETIKSKGLVTSELYEALPRDLNISSAIGHVRYSTCGSSSLINAQPLSFKCNKGEMSFSHNGNIPDSDIIKRDLIQKGSIFQTSSDSEILVHLMSRIPGNDFDSSLQSALSELKGAYAMLILHDDQVIAFRDPNGFRPLSYGEIDGGYVFSSETCALDLINAKNVQDVKPGEIVFCRKGQIEKKRFASVDKINQCVFELIYFSRPDSIVFEESVYETRIKMGEKLSQSCKKDIDIVISVPDSGNTAALGFSVASGIPFQFGLMRNHYMGRTFIRPEQRKRTESVRIKLNPIKSVIEGKSIAVIDDSLVRGTTSRKIVQILKESGAKEIHLFLSSPEIKHSCYFGIDTPNRKELISSIKTSSQIANDIGADSVTFLDIEDLKKCLKSPNNYCYACFSGDYPIKVTEDQTI